MNPFRFEKEIAAFEEEDRRNPPRPGVILFTGSSSITHWNRQLPADMAPLPVVGRGFGGSTMADLLEVAERIIPPWVPRAVVVYEGDNDLAAGRTVEAVAGDFERFIGWLFERCPAVRLYLLAVKYSPARRSLWPLMRALNERLAARCAAEQNLFFVDTATPLMTENGEARKELYGADGLHLNEAGYAVWREIIRSALLAWEFQEIAKT